MNIGGRIVVLGGYGNFGARVCRALAAHTSAEIIVAGRHRERAEVFAAQLSAQFPGTVTQSAELDIADPRFVRRLGVIAPIVVVHTAGPFQGQPYTVAEACLACRSHYLDLADGREFVSGIGAYDRAARKRDVLLVSGASTLPGVSTAAIRSLREGLTHIRSIEMSIVPAGSTFRGAATIAAVLSYCGKAFDVIEDGRWVRRHGWLDARRERYPHVQRRVAACDVPDLQLLPQCYPGVETVTFHAGPHSPIQHYGLRFMALLRRAAIVRDWTRFSALFTHIDRLFAGGGDIGGMKIVLRGLDEDGRERTRSWNVTALADHGPEICRVPATALARKLLTGEITERGARACIELIDLKDFDRETAAFDIDWRIEEDAASCSIPT